MTPVNTSAQVTIPGKYAYIGPQPILVDYQPVGTEYLIAYRTSNGVAFTYTNGTYRSFSLNTNSATPIVITYNGVPYIITNDQNPSGGTSIYVSTMKPNDIIYNYTLPTSSFISPLAVQLSGPLLQLVFGGYSLFINLTDMKGYIYNMTTTYIGSRYYVVDGSEIYVFDDNWNYIRTLQLQYTGSSTDYSILIPYVIGTSNNIYLAFDFKGSSEIVKLAKIVGTSLYAFNTNTGTMIPHVKSDGERLGVLYSKTFYGEIQPNTTESAQYIASQSSIPSNFIFILYGYSGIFSVLEHNNQYYVAMGSNLYVIPKPASMNAGPLITPPFTLFLYLNTQWKGTTLLQDFSIAVTTGSYRQPSVQTLLPTQATLTENNGVLTFSTISIIDLMNDISTRFTVEMDEANNVLIYPNNNFVFGVYNYSDYKLVSTTESEETPCKANMSTGSRVFDGRHVYGYLSGYFKEPIADLLIKYTPQGSYYMENDITRQIGIRDDTSNIEIISTPLKTLSTTDLVLRGTVGTVAPDVSYKVVPVIAKVPVQVTKRNKSLNLLSQLDTASITGCSTGSVSNVRSQYDFDYGSILCTKAGTVFANSTITSVKEEGNKIKITLAEKGVVAISNKTAIKEIRVNNTILCKGSGCSSYYNETSGLYEFDPVEFEIILANTGANLGGVSVGESYVKSLLTISLLVIPLLLRRKLL